MNDLDLLAAAIRPVPPLREPAPDSDLAEVDAPRMCREILLAIPAGDLDLRKRVSDFFDRIMVITGKHTVDGSLLYAYKETPKDLEEHIERQQREEAAYELSKYVVQAWKDIKIDGHFMRELTAQAVVIKPRPIQGRAC